MMRPYDDLGRGLALSDRVQEVSYFRRRGVALAAGWKRESSSCRRNIALIIG